MHPQQHEDEFQQQALSALLQRWRTSRQIFRPRFPCGATNSLTDVTSVLCPTVTPVTSVSELVAPHGKRGWKIWRDLRQRCSKADNACC